MVSKDRNIISIYYPMELRVPLVEIQDVSRRQPRERGEPKLVDPLLLS